MSYLFGGNTGLTQEQLDRRRKVADQLRKSVMTGTPRTATEGLFQVGEALLGRALDRKNDKAANKLQAEDGMHIGYWDMYEELPEAQRADIDARAAKGENMVKMLEALGVSQPQAAPQVSGGSGGNTAYGGGDGMHIGYWDMYEEMTPAQKAEVDRRASAGESMPQVLDGLAQSQPSTERPDMGKRNQNTGISIDPQPAFGADNVTARSIAQKEIAQRDAMNGLSSVLEELQSDPSLLDSAHTLTGRGQTALLRLRDRLGVDAWDLSSEEEERLGNTTAYKQELLTRVNQYIKDITGAQVGQGDETRRLMAVQANEGDSPTQVIAKITNALEMARLDIARRRYMQRSDGEAPSDKEIREILKDRGRELYNQAISGGMNADQARMQAASILAEEFGL